MKYGLSDTSLKLIESALSTFDMIEKAIIFGSRAIGNFKSGSDIDMVISGDGVNYEIVNALSIKLNEELPLPYYFDVLGYSLIESSELKKHIDKFGIIFYEKSVI